ncbi:MAG: sodium/solute symporter [Bacteroidales bacterium]|nr:sodium/solute symporter [Bacteroidales bacterium]
MTGSGFATIDFVILGAYIVLLVCLGLFLSRNKGGKEKSSNDYFLAGNTLTWWAVGASLIAANISAEQMIGMAGSGFKIGLSIAAYELIAAASLILVGKYLLPLMIEKKIYTMPQFLRERYNSGVGLAFSILWLLLYVFVNLTSVAWLGCLAIQQILGIPETIVMTAGDTIYYFDAKTVIILILFLIAGIYSIYGGLAAVAWTDVLQVVFLIGGGIITTYYAICAVSGEADSFFKGISTLYDTCKAIPNDTHFNLIVSKSANEAAFKDLPGIAAIVGGLWLTNIGYWGFNQYIIQKGLAAKSIDEAKKGLIFAGFLKILIPFIAAVPGICAFVIINDPDLAAKALGTVSIPDESYPWLVHNFAPIGIKGLSFAALAAAIISSLASMFNSTSTIFTIDIYKSFINKNASDKKLVNIGRITSFIALLLALFTTKPLLGGLDQAFQYIQEYSSFLYPGIVVIFSLGLLWKRASGTAAVWAAILTLPISIVLKFGIPEMPFQSRSAWAFIFLLVVFVAISYKSKKTVAAEAIAEADKKAMNKWSKITGICAAICVIIATIQKIAYAIEPSGWALTLENYGFEAFYCAAGLFGMVAMFLHSDSNDKVRDPKALPINLSLFKTNAGFALGSFGIIVILVALYALLW